MNGLFFTDFLLSDWALHRGRQKQQKQYKKIQGGESKRESPSNFSVKIVNEKGQKVHANEWQDLKVLLRDELKPDTQPPSVSSKNDSEIILALFLMQIKGGLPVFTTNEALNKYSKSAEWGLKYRSGHSCPVPICRVVHVRSYDGVISNFLVYSRFCKKPKFFRLTYRRVPNY